MKTTLKIRTAIEIANALRALDGTKKIVTEGGAEKAVTVPFTFGGNTLFAMAKNLRALSTIEDNFTTARNALVKQLSDGKSQVPAEKVPEFQASLNELMEGEEEVELGMLTQGDLKLDTNPIAPAVIAALMPIIEG